MNDCQKLLDNGWRVIIFRNVLTTYTARAVRTDVISGRVTHETDDKTPLLALRRLTEKVIFGRIMES